MKKSRSQPSAPPAPSLSRRRRWLFRLAAMVAAPLLLLALLEFGLRLAGVGHSMSFFLPVSINGQACLAENDRFGWRFFGLDMARAPFPFAFPKIKPPRTIRVFIFGESAAIGDPQPEFGFGRILQVLLAERYPDRRFEVINTAMTAINSHVILPIARDCATENGDFWVIYMGNNEVVGPYGSGTVFGPQAANLALVRAGVAFKGTRIGQALGALVRHAQKQSANQSEWGGMTMFLHNHVRQDDPRMATVYRNFERNLHDIIDIGRRGGARVVVSTVARNLKDCAPFASDHRPGLAGAELAQWDTFYQAAIQAQAARHAAEAIDFLEKAAKIDDSFAEARFRWGQCLLALGQDKEAAQQFSLACDEDTLRFRADNRINNIIRRTGAPLVDAEAVLAASSPHELTGDEFLYEHVHLNFAGNYLVARALAEEVGRALPSNATLPWATEEECARRLGWNNFTRRKGAQEILSRLSNPPFNDQASNRQESERFLREIEQLKSATPAEALREEELQTKAAAAAAPDDWILQENLAYLQQQTGDATGAAESWQRVVRLVPQYAEAWQALGLALAGANRDDEAIAAFEQGGRLAPESVTGLNSLGELYAREGHPEKAAEEFQQVLRAKPYWGPAHLGLGKALEAMGKPEEAKGEFEEALKNRVKSPDSFNALAKFAFARGWYGAAATNFSDALRLDPSDAETQVNLGVALDKLGRRAEARRQYDEALRLQPNFAEAHFCLGLELGEEGNDAAAATQFAEAVRLKPELIEARINLGVALSNQHLEQQALEQFEEVLRRDPKNQTALARAAQLRAHLPPAKQTP